MAEDFASRTEAPTPRRREEAREQGQIAFSTELVTGVVLLVGVAALALGADRLGGGMLHEARFGLGTGAPPEMTAAQAQALLGRVLGRCLDSAGPLLGGVFVAALAACLLQSGLRPTPALLAFKWERLAPTTAAAKLFSWNQALRGLLAVLRLTAAVFLAWWVLSGQAPAIGHLGDVPLAPAVGRAWGMVLRLALAVAGGLLLLGVGDYLFQFARFEASLRMSRQELKDETKREEGDPQVKARVRRLQREAAKKKMFHEARRATVVVTNPTHLAVALRYDRGTMTAPKVVAKGAGHVARRIADIARRHGVPVVERKSLAQALFRSVKLNQEIPLALYQAAAEVLAHVYRLRGQQPPARPA